MHSYRKETQSRIYIRRKSIIGKKIGQGGFRMADVIVTFLLVIIIVPVIGYIVKMKKKGQVCIGCPSASKCGRNCHCNK